MYEGNLLKYYNYLKKKELERIKNKLKKQFNNQSVKIEFYCINKDIGFLEKSRYGKYIKSILSEPLNIERKIYNKIVEQAFLEIKNLYYNLIKPKLPKINAIWNILEDNIKLDLHIFLEQIIFIDSIIKRETPTLVVIAKDSPYFIKPLLNRIKYPIKFFFLFKSNFNHFFLKINNFILFFYEIYLKLKTLKIKTFFKIRTKSKRFVDFKYNDDPLIGICLPNKYLYSAIKPIYKELINQNANVRTFQSSLLEYFLFPKPSFKDFKYYLFLKKFWKSKRYNNKLFGYINDDFKDIMLYILKNRLKLKLKSIIYVISLIENEIKFFNYKVIVILNEFGLVGKIICLVCKKYNIPVYFTPSVGIPNTGSEITPYMSDMINVEGSIDKEFLVNNGVDSMKIHIRGSPKYEAILKRENIKIQKLKDIFSKKIYSLSTDKQKILLTVNPIPNESNRVLLNKVINALKKIENTQLIIKLHPRQRGEFIRQVVKKLKYKAIIIKDVNLFDIINSCYILLTQDSAVILDAMIVGIPLISLDLMNKRLFFSGKHNYNDEKYIIKVYNEEELYEKLKLLLNNPTYYIDYKKRLKQNLKSLINYNKDYSPTKQIVSDLIKFYNK